MLGLMIDAVLLNIALYIVDSDEAGDFLQNLLACAAAAVLNFVCLMAVVRGGGMHPFFALPLMIVADGLVVMKVYSFTLEQTAKTIGIWMVARIALDFVLGMGFAAAGA
jgi:hypothetical protein